MSTTHPSALSRISPDHDACVHALRDVLRASAAGEASTQSWFAGHLRRLGCQVDTLTFFPRDLCLDYEFADPVLIDPSPRTSVLGRLSGSDGGPSLLMFAHSDCEEERETADWRHAPLMGEIEDGRLYGWGAADDLVGVAAMICALETLLNAGLCLRGMVTLACVPSKRHARGIVAALQNGYLADAALYLHAAESGNGLRDIKAITPGVLRFRVVIEGQPAPTREPEHTPFHHQAVNPIQKACSLVRALQGLGETHDCPVNVQLAYVRAGAQAELHRMPTCCVLGGSISFPPVESLRDVQARAEAAVHSAAVQDPWLHDHPPTLEWLMGISGAQIPLDHPFYRTVSRAISTVTGEDPAPYALHAASDIRHPLLHTGIPCVGIGPLAGDLVQAGGTDEWVDVDDYVRFVGVTAGIIADWCVIDGV